MDRRSAQLVRMACVALAAVACMPPSSASGAARPGSAGVQPAKLVGGPRATRTAGSSSQVSTSETPIPVPASATPTPGRRLSSDQVLAIASALPKMRAVRAKYPGSYAGAYLKLPLNWQVSYFSRGGKKEIGQVIIADSSGQVLEQWTGFQVAWTMARGYPGAFGRHLNSLYLWLPLCVLFFLPFFNWRRPFSLLHLDLLVLLSFSVSLAFFNHGHIYASVPLAYPPLLYLLARMLVLLRPGRRRGEPGDPRRTGDDGGAASAPRDPAAPGVPVAPEGFAVPGSFASQGGFAAPARPADFGPRVALVAPPTPVSVPHPAPGVPPERARPAVLPLLVPASWLVLGVVFLIGFRIALNVTDSNVIDVGYAGVIGAHRIVDGKPLYGSYPTDNEHGDTYGPVNYEAYVPFERIFGWSGTWDDLPAAHAAAIIFDLLAVGLLFLLGRRLRGPTLGIALAYAWVSYPFTLFALESNSNDTLVAVLLLAALLFAMSAPARGAFAALAGLTKFAPLALAPLLSTYGVLPGQGAAVAGDSRGSGPRRRARAYAAFWLAFVLTVALVSIPALTHDSLHTIYERTIVYQSNRGSPFSVWGLYGGLHGVETGVEIAALAFALLLAVVPRRADLVGLAAACAAALIALQLGVEHWFYLYLPWFFPLVMVALLGRFQVTGRLDRPGEREVVASGVARSNQPAVVASSGSGLP